MVDAPVRVIAAVIQSDGRYLVAQRPAHHRHGELWEFPGGKVEAGETDLQATRRELDEELRVHVLEVGEVLAEHRDPGTRFHVVFLEATIQGQPVAVEHTDLAWRTPAELADLPMAPSDARFVAQLVGS